MKISSFIFLLCFCLGVLPLLGQGKVDPAEAIQFKPTPKTTLTFSGALWVNFSVQDWLSTDRARRRGLHFDNLRLAFDGRHGSEESYLLFSTQMRFWGYMYAIHHGWFGYHFNDRHQIELGVTQVPFGNLPFATHSFWFGLGYYLGMEDDYDAGLKYHYSGRRWDAYLAFFRNEEYNDATKLDRFAPDLVLSGNQQNEEFNQYNGRISYTMGKGTGNSSEFGLSAEYGGVDNLITDRQGHHWQAAFHYRGEYGDWNPEFQISRYEYHPENPDTVDSRLIQLGFFESQRLVAARGTLINVNLRRFWDVQWGPFDRFRAYVNYSKVFKDEAVFADSELINPGAVLESGPFWIWFDFLFGKNAWFLNDSEANSGPGEGAETGNFEFRYNVNFEWYF